MTTSASSAFNVLVTVRPSQSAFFAGETFSCTVTFANIAQPRPAPAPAQLSPVYRQQISVSPRTASIDLTRHEPGSAPPTFDRGHRSALSLSEQSGLGLASRAQDEHAVVRPPSPQRPFPYDLGDGTTPASSTFPPPPLPQPRRPAPIAGSDPRRKSLPARRGLIGRPVPPLETSPSRGSRQGSGGTLRTRSVWGLDGLRSSSTPDLFAAAAAGAPSKRTPPATSRKGSRVMGPSPTVAPRPLTQLSALRGTVPTAIEEEEAAPDPAAMPSPRPALMARSLSAPSSPETEKSGPSSPRTSPKGYRSSPLAPARPSEISVTAPTPDPDRFDDDDDGEEGVGSPADVSATSVISPSMSLSSLATVPYATPSPMHSYARSVSGATEFYGLGRAANDTMESVLRDEVGRWAGGGARRAPSYAHRRVSSLAHGAPPRTPSTARPPSAQSETETLLWTFAKLEAHFEVDGRLIKPHEFLSVKKALFSGVGGGSGPGIGMVGGGTLGGAATTNGTAQTSGWRGWLFGSGAEQAAAADHAQPDAASATVSMAQEGDAGEDEGMGGSLEARRARAMKDRAVPMFSTPPSVVAVDMKLAPGESKTYTFSIGIPADLPPSFKGRAIKFQYSFVVGTNRARSPGASAPPASAKQVSRVMRVPVRVYNNVSVTGARPFYDLTNPIVYARDEATTVCTDDAPSPAASLARRASSHPTGPGGETELQAYAGRLLDALATSSPDMSRPTLSPSTTLRGIAFPAPETADAEPHGPSMRPEMRARHTGGLEHALPSRTAAGGAVDEDEEGGCKGAVEVVTRSAPKMSFDITKDGSIVAQLALIKSAYRLGESVDGVVVINSGGEGSGRVLRYSAQLETHELVETSIATRPAHQVQHATRRLHADHHEATLDTARSGFSLAIPSGASPDFSTSGVKLQWSVRLTLLFVPPSKQPVPVAPRGAGGHIRTGSAAGGGAASASAGAGLNASHGRSKSYAYGFEPQVAVPPSFVPTGSPHLLPVQNDDGGTLQTVYRGVPDLGYVPILYDAPAHDFVQQQPSMRRQRSSSSLSSFGSQSKAPILPQVSGSVVLIPAKVETVECSIPIRVYPGNTPFTPAVTTFFA